MKIALINPPSPRNRRYIREGRCTQEAGIWTTVWPPISLATIGALLEKYGREVRIIDCAAEGMRAEKLLLSLKGFRPSVVIWSSATFSIDGDLSLAGAIRSSLGKAVVTAVFGTHASVFAKECLAREAGPDCVVRNEPELTCLELVKAVESRAPLHGIPGLSYRRPDGAIVHNQARPFIEDLDSLPYPAWHLVKTGRYRLPLLGKPFVMVTPVRGCPHHCIFCASRSYYGDVVRKRSVGSLIDEIRHIRTDFGIKDIFFWADTFTIDRGYTLELCRALIKEGLGVSWVANSRVDTVDADTLGLMRRAGCWMVSFGIESLSSGILEKSAKGSRPEDALRATRLAREAGLIVVGHFILGLPGETEETARETLRLMKGLDMDLVQIYSAVPFPGTELYSLARANLWIEGAAWEDFRQDKAIMRLPALSPERAQEWIARGYREFYFNWRSLPRMWRLCSRADAGYALLGAARFVKRFL